jgi:hypothetical protein
VGLSASRLLPGTLWTLVTIGACARPSCCPSRLYWPRGPCLSRQSLLESLEDRQPERGRARGQVCEDLELDPHRVGECDCGHSWLMRPRLFEEAEELPYHSLQVLSVQPAVTHPRSVQLAREGLQRCPCGGREGLHQGRLSSLKLERGDLDDAWEELDGRWARP